MKLAGDEGKVDNIGDCDTLVSFPRSKGFSFRPIFTDF